MNPGIIGNTSQREEFEVEKGAIRAFARAIGDDNPLYLDEAFAKLHGYASLVAPPTFPTTFWVQVPELNIEPTRALHGGQEYCYERPIVAGDILCCQSTVVDVYERSGKLGSMTFIVIETRGEDREGSLVFRGRNTVIVR